MWKRVPQVLNIIMGSALGVFIGHGIYVYWDMQTRPGLYAMQSAPWYTSILTYGIVTLIVLAVCIVLKVVARNRENGRF